MKKKLFQNERQREKKYLKIPNWQRFKKIKKKKKRTEEKTIRKTHTQIQKQ